MSVQFEDDHLENAGIDEALKAFLPPPNIETSILKSASGSIRSIMGHHNISMSVEDNGGITEYLKKKVQQRSSPNKENFPEISKRVTVNKHSSDTIQTFPIDLENEGRNLNETQETCRLMEEIDAFLAEPFVYSNSHEMQGIANNANNKKQTFENETKLGLSQLSTHSASNSVNAPSEMSMASQSIQSFKAIRQFPFAACSSQTSLRTLSIDTTLPSFSFSDRADGSLLSNETDIGFGIGDVFWGMIDTYPYWPCIVWPDGDGEFISKTITKADNTSVKIHVRFFADKGSRNWVNRKRMIAFNGLAEFEKKRPKTWDRKPGTRNRGAHSKFLWHQAIDEAEKVLLHSREQRWRVFEDLILEASSKSSEVKNRKASICSRRVQRSTESSDDD